MIKKLLLVFVVVLNIYASDDKYTLRLYEKVLPLVLSSNDISVYTDKNVKKLFSNNHIFKIVTECEQADIIVGSKFENVECLKKKPLFATSYSSYKNNLNSFGAFYWRKGRPQFRLNKDVIQRYDFILPDSLERFAQ